MRLLRVGRGICCEPGIGCAASSGSPKPSSASPKRIPSNYRSGDPSQSFRDGYDIVQRLRTGLVHEKERGFNYAADGPVAVSLRTGAGLLLPRQRPTGGVEALRTLSAPSIESMKFLDAATATATLPGIGSSVVSGAIVVRMQGGT